ncbi:hypothetical protein EDC04DRAFT_3035349 [Pisolithus marmoratus]|nr:hypothetical protein EDC04DRAFT_3035349 [Pisolithus marmoratus]
MRYEEDRFDSTLAARALQLAHPEALNWSTVGGGDVPPVTVSPAKDPVPPQQPAPTMPTQGNGVTRSNAPVVPVNSTKTFPLPTSTTKANNSAVVDEELAKREARGERFGIPLAEPKQPPQRQAKKVSQTKQSGPVSGGLEKPKNPAERSRSTKVKSGSKRTAAEEG